MVEIISEEDLAKSVIYTFIEIIECLVFSN